MTMKKQTTSSRSAKAATSAKSSTSHTCATAGPTGDATTGRAERIAITLGIDREVEQLALVGDKAGSYYSAQTLRYCERADLEALAGSWDIDVTVFSDKGLIAEILSRQSARWVAKHNARAMRVEQSLERITHLAERLRETLPDGMRLGDYYGEHKSWKLDKLKQYGIKKRRAARRVA